MEVRFIKELPTEEMLRETAGRYPETNIPAIMAVTRLLGTAAELEKALEVYLSEHGVSLSRFYVLTMLRRYEPDGLKPTDLADKIGVTRGNMTGLVDGLEKSGLDHTSGLYDGSTDRLHSAQQPGAEVAGSDPARASAAN